MAQQKVLHMFGDNSIPKPVMPADLAAHPPDMSTKKLIHSGSPSHEPQPAETRTPAAKSPSSTILSCKSTKTTCSKKKRVVFADDRGLALTTVRLFVTEPSLCSEELSPSSVQLQDKLPAKPESPQQRSSTPQWQEPQVQLSSCSVLPQMLGGTVHVSNVDVKKIVRVHITNDSWRSHRDVPCTFLQQHRREPGTEVFIFTVPLPLHQDTCECLEFCISVQLDGGTFLLWDVNGGHNYRVHFEGPVHGYVPRAQNHRLKTQNPQRLATWPINMSPNMNNPASPRPQRLSRGRTGLDRTTRMCLIKG